MIAAARLFGPIRVDSVGENRGCRDKLTPMATTTRPLLLRPIVRLTYGHIHDMVSHMKTTLNIDDTVMDRLRKESARTGRTMSELVEMALRQLLQARPRASQPDELPVFSSGGATVDVADREALYRAMEGR